MEITTSRILSLKETYLPAYKWARLGNMILIIYQPLKNLNDARNILIAVIGPHWPGVLFTSCIICLITYLNIILLSPTSIYFKILLLSLSILSQIFLYLTALVDPGITHLFSKDSNDENISFLEDNQHHESTSSNTSLSIPYCDICEIYQYSNLRLAHCSYCNCCIEQLDHHCPWMGKCIGKNNMRYFQYFIGIVILYVFFIVTSAVLF